MIVGVMASGKKSFADDYGPLAKEVGSTIAEQGFYLLTGGGGGLMKAVGEEFLTIKPRTGKLISILRAKEFPELRGAKREWEPQADNELGEIVIRTHLPLSGAEGRDRLSRNHINALTSDLVVVLPGDEGTHSELQLAWEYDKEIMIFLGKGNVHGKTAEKLMKEFQGITIGHIKTDVEDWLNRKRTNLLSRQK